MTTTDNVLSDASAQLLGRPPEEHFATWSAWRQSAQRDRSDGEEVKAPARSFIFVELDDGSLGVSIDDAHPRVALSSWALEQCVRIAGDIRPELLRRLDASESARLLNTLWLRQGKTPSPQPVSDRLALVVPNADDPAARHRLRAVTSQQYERVWDAEVADEIDRWLTAAGMTPTVPTLNANLAKRDEQGRPMPALFRGDRSSFCFFSQPKRDDGGDPSDEFGGLRRGYFFGNSEVGFTALHGADFLFRDMCANFLIWGAEAVERYRARHVSGAADFMRKVMAPRIRTISAELQDDELRLIQRAAEAPIHGDGSYTDANRAAAVDRLRRMRVTKALAEQAVEDARLRGNAPLAPKQPPLSYWSLANGLSWASKGLPHAEQRVAVQETAAALVRRAPKRPRSVVGAGS